MTSTGYGNVTSQRKRRTQSGRETSRAEFLNEPTPRKTERKRERERERERDRERDRCSISRAIIKLSPTSSTTELAVLLERFFPFFLFFLSVHARHTGGSIDQPQRTVCFDGQERPPTPGRSYTMASERSVNNGSFPIKNSVCALARCYARSSASSLFYTGISLGPCFTFSPCPFYFCLCRILTPPYGAPLEHVRVNFP